jgi:DNA-binding winged helix-turn-helix (wHTH) protein
VRTRFGCFELDPARRLLLRERREIHLTPKAFELLCLLVDAAPRVVPKAEIHARLWPRCVVSDDTLFGLVKEIRRALDDRGRSPPLIRTVHRIGYGLDAPVTRSTRKAGLARWLIVGERRFALTEGENLIGRDPVEAGVLLDYATISRRHARVIVSGTGAVLEDLGSKNGTTIDDARLTGSRALRNGDRFACGQVWLTYRESSAAAPTVTQASRAGGP